MNKSIWVNIIKKHTEPIRDGEKVLYSVKNKGTGKCLLYVFLKDTRLDSYESMVAERISIDSDDFLILYRSEKIKYTNSGEEIIETVNYILWQDIRSMRIICKDKI
jgi:hypothetical protein